MSEQLKKSLVWEKWLDPLGSNLNDVEFPGALGHPDNEDDDEEEWIDDIPLNNKKLPIPSRGFQLFYTPMGVMPMTDYMTPDKNFNFWVAHTNFNIGAKAKLLIESVPGVESLFVFSRYRFRIG